MFVFEHVGLTTEPQPDENWVEQSRSWVASPRNHPEHIDLRYAPDTTLPEASQSSCGLSRRLDRGAYRRAGDPHSAFVVSDFVRGVFVRKHGMVFEYMLYLNGTWFGA